jgi:hypothetical protein
MKSVVVNETAEVLVSLFVDEKQLQQPVYYDGSLDFSQKETTSPNVRYDISLKRSNNQKIILPPGEYELTCKATLFQVNRKTKKVLYCKK